MPELQESAERLLETVVDDVVGENRDMTVEQRAMEGPPVEVLVDAARGADLLVVGSRGRGGFKQLLLGSVSQQLAHHAPCPLVIYRRAQ
jgi:nucleotide-binding universal stress UspA family protein